jgi:hypothetical protein
MAQKSLRFFPIAVLLPLLSGASVSAVRTARAQDNSAAVEALFAEGKKLVAEGKLADACPKFLASYNLENRSGTLLNLADCYEKTGKLATAWARFLEAKALATRAAQADRAELASQRAAALEPRLSKLTINVATPPAGLVVSRDGVVLAAAVYGVAVPVDGGKHTLTASAPGKTSWTQEVDVGETGDQKSFDVPHLPDAAGPAGATLDEEKHGVSTRTIAGIVVAGVGVVSVGLGSYFGFAAIGKKNDSNSNGNCGFDGQPNDCTAQGVSLRSTAVTDATISTVLIIGGAAAAAGGVVLWLTDPASKGQATVGFDGRMLRLAGTF